MTTLGPYVIFEDKKPSEWCYFDFGVTNQPICYTSLYPGTDANVVWLEKTLTDKVPIYTYDPKTAQPTCFVMDGDKLYQVPFNAKTKVVNMVQQSRLTDQGIVWDLAMKQASMYGIDKKYPESHPAPDLSIVPDVPEQSSTPEPDKPAEKKSIDMSEAKDLLQVKQCTRVLSVEDCPEVLADREMYVWEDRAQWHYRTSLLGDVISDVFDANLDKAIIDELKQRPIGEIGKIGEIPNMTLMRLSRPYLILNPYQQGQVLAGLHRDWPLSPAVSVIKQIQACHIIIEREKLPVSVEEEKLPALAEEIVAFRRYLLPSAIDRLFEHNFYPAKEADPASDKDTTIGDIIVYIDKLVAASARALGDTQTLVLKDPPENSRVKCGEFNHGNNVSKLIAHGEFFEFVLEWKYSGSIDFQSLSTENLIKLLTGLEGIIDPQTHHDYMDVANDLLAAIAAQSNISQETAKEELNTMCSEIVNQIYVVLVASFETRSTEERAETIEFLREHPSLLPTTLICIAAEKGHMDIVKLFLDKGADVNAIDTRGGTALIFTAYSGHLDVIKLLFDKGADVNAKSSDGLTALMLASCAGNQDIVRMLLDKGAKINEQTITGNCALLLASSKGAWSVVKLLLEKGANSNSISTVSYETALKFASIAGQLDIVTLLLDKGAEIHAQDSAGQNALLHACGAQKWDIAKLLLEKGAHVNAPDSDGNTALYFATRFGEWDVVKLLLDKGVKVNDKDNEGYTALHHAASIGHLDILKLLLKNNADANAKTDRGLTPLMLAAQHGHMAIVNLLLEKGVNTIAKDHYRRTALDHATSHEQWGVIKQLLMNNDVIQAYKNKNPKEHAHFFEIIKEHLPIFIQSNDDYKKLSPFFTLEQGKLATHVLQLQGSIEGISKMTTSHDAHAFAAALISNDQKRIKNHIDSLIEKATQDLHETQPVIQLIDILSSLEPLWKKKVLSALNQEPKLKLKSEQEIKAGIERYVMAKPTANAKITANFKNVLNQIKGGVDGHEVDDSESNLKH